MVLCWSKKNPVIWRNSAPAWRGWKRVGQTRTVWKEVQLSLWGTWCRNSWFSACWSYLHYLSIEVTFSYLCTYVLSYVFRLYSNLLFVLLPLIFIEFYCNCICVFVTFLNKCCTIQMHRAANICSFVTFYMTCTCIYHKFQFTVMSPHSSVD